MAGKNKKKHIVFGTAAVVLLMAILSAAHAISRMRADKTDTAEGLACIRAAEEADIQAVRHKIKTKREGEDPAPAEADYKILFEDSVIMGDSVAQGLKEYDFLNASSVTACAGTDLGAQTEMLGGLNPEIVFICCGSDGIGGERNDIEGFIRDCGKALDCVGKAFPGVKIFVNSIFPARADAAAKTPHLEYLSLYNKELQELCDKRNIAFIDNTDLAAEEFYEDDGVHFKPDFYPRWLERMRKVADLQP